MRVGIITLFDNDNLGNRLQNYAVQQILLGYADEVITIKNKPYFKTWKQRIMRSSFLAESVILNRMIGKKRKVKFLEFNKRFININRRTYCYQHPYRKLGGADTCDKYCVGSDQVWNPYLGRSSSFNYLCFAETCNAFSLSASFGVTTVSDEYVDEIRRGLQHIDYISVREADGERIVKELTGREDVSVLIDPTMMLSAEAWNQVALTPSYLPCGKYAVCYFLGENSDERKKIIADLAEEHSCTIIDVLDMDHVGNEIGPSEFIYLIANSLFICTDSFHACAFSFIYQKPFLVFPRVDHTIDMSSRIKSFIDLFGLYDNYAENDVVPCNWMNYDYSLSARVLFDEQQKMTNFLKKVFLRK